MNLRERLAEYVQACFTGIWIVSHEHQDALAEIAMLCQREGIVINIFLLPSWSQSREDIRFAHRLAESTKGRVFFTAGRDLDRFVVWDYVNRRKSIIG